MAETANISVVANKIANEIFSAFHWKLHPQHDTNFSCVLDHHISEGGKKKDTHPEDVIFHYIDPYLERRIYLHTDLKSYAKSTIQVKRIREALHSLAWTVECAHVSPGWKEQYVVDPQESYEVRGLLFVVNHDNSDPARFGEYLRKIARLAIPVAANQQLHVLTPEKITDLFAVAADLRQEVGAKRIAANYRFHYPDLTLWKRRVADDFRAGATIESLMSPYFLVRHDGVREGETQFSKRGIVVYYARDGKTAEEFVYLFDSLLRHQLVNSKEEVRIRVFSRDKAPNIYANFERAKNWYCNEWGFHEDREAEINAIKLETVSGLLPNYSAEHIGWREEAK